MYWQQQLDGLLANRRILIAGYGREGKSTHTLLQQYVPSAQVTVAENDEAIYACLKQAQGAPFDLIIKSPGIPSMKLEGHCDPSSITSQTDIFLQLCAEQTIGVTGTKGKSTTSALIAHILGNAMQGKHPVVMAGNMGIPLFDILPQIDNSTLVVAELSCHQLENIHRAPHIGIILNLYQEHLDHYHDYMGYKMAKMQLMLRQQHGDHCIYCTDSQDLSDLVEQLKPEIQSTIHPYSLHQAKQSPLSTIESPLPGDHNLSNTHAAFLATSLLGIDTATFAQALTTFHGLPHRLEPVGTYNGITFYNDSISTIPEATIAALRALPHVGTLILGGYDRGIDYSPLGNYLANHDGIDNIVFVGNAGRRMKDEWNALPGNPLSSRNTIVENDYSRVVDWCYGHTLPGSLCLLSPAAASYDSFKNFEQRGDTFKQLVQNHS